MPNEEEAETTDSPLTFSPEQEQRLNEIVNNAVAGVRKGLTKTFEASLSQFQAKPAVEPEAKTEGQDPKDLRIAELERKMQKAAEERNASRKGTARAQLESQLQKAGVRSELLGPLADSMQLRGALAIPDDGEAVLVLDDETYTIGDGVKAWLKTNEAKAFVSAPEAKAPKSNASMRLAGGNVSGDDLDSIASKYL